MPTNLFGDTGFPMVDPTKDYYAELVGPGLKYADNEAFARSRVEADIHIARLEDEQKRLREDLATRMSYEDFLKKLETAPPVTPPPVADHKDPATLNPADLERLLELKLTQRENARTAEQNVNLVAAKLNEVLGPNYAQHLKRQAADLGMSEASVMDLAATNPKALFKLFGIGEKTPGRDSLFDSPPRSQTTTGTSFQGQKRGDAYYEEIRKTKPELYWSPKIQNEIYARVSEIGAEAYYAS